MSAFFADQSLLVKLGARANRWRKGELEADQEVVQETYTHSGTEPPPPPDVSKAPNNLDPSNLN